MSVLDRFRLDGRRAFVTGGSRGLGRAIAQALAEAGADLVLVGRNRDTLLRARDAIAATGRRVDLIEGDLSIPEEAERVCAVVDGDFGPVDVLINNVGGRRESVPLQEQSVEAWKRLIDLNLTSAFVCTKRLGPGMVQRGRGRIINVASICGQVATRNIHGRH